MELAKRFSRQRIDPLLEETPALRERVAPARVLAAPVTVNRAARTVEVVWSTGARARNFVAPLGPIIEELDMRPEAVRMDALRSGRAPVLDPAGLDPGCHGLDALAVAGQQQAGAVAAKRGDAVGMAERGAKRLDIGGEPRFNAAR